MYDLKNRLNPPTERACELVYHILPSKGPRAFTLFVKCLQEEKQHLGHQSLVRLFTLPQQSENDNIPALPVKSTNMMAGTSAKELFERYNQGLLACLPMKDSTFLEVLKQKMLLPDEVKNSLKQMDRNTERSSYFLEKMIKAGFDKGDDSCFINLLAAMVESSYDNVKDLGMEIHSKLSNDVVQAMIAIEETRV